MNDEKSLDISHLSFLIIDDNKYMRSLLSQILHAFGVRAISEAIEGADALKTLQVNLVDVIICDWAMTPIDGIEFIKMLRRDKTNPNRQVPIIMISGFTEAVRVIEARDAGCNEFLAKPVSAEKLYNRIYNVIKKPRPWIEIASYIGPDRRRKIDPATFHGPERRKK